MLNGEGTGEIPSAVDSLDELVSWRSQNSEGGNGSPISSQYSSCGESEFERYCSANSVMGTPSACSSVGNFHEYLDSELGSTTGFDCGLENFSLGGRSSRKYEDRKLSSLGGSCNLESLGGKGTRRLRNAELGQESIVMENVLRSQEDRNGCWLREESCVDGDDGMQLKDCSGSHFHRVVDFNTVLDGGLHEYDEGGDLRWRDLGVSQLLHNSAVNVHTIVTSDKESSSCNSDSHIMAEVEEEIHSQIISEKVDNCSFALEPHCIEQHETEDRVCSDEEKRSSRYEHSEGEDSMFGFGTDDEQKIDSCQRKNMQYYQELEIERRNPLFMNPSVAFGSDDWDDYLQETERTNITSTASKLQEKKHLDVETKNNFLTSTPETNLGYPGPVKLDSVVRDISLGSSHVQGADELAECIKTFSLAPLDILDVTGVDQGEEAEGNIVTNTQVRCVDVSAADVHTSSVSDIFGKNQDPLLQGAPLKTKPTDDSLHIGHPLLGKKLLINTDEGGESNKSKSQFHPPFDTTGSEFCSASAEAYEDIVDVAKDPYAFPLAVNNNIKGIVKDSPISFNLVEDHYKQDKTEYVELNEFYNEVVHEMEEILLASGESSGANFSPANRIYQSQTPLPSRDGGPTASTSGKEDAYHPIHHPLRIDGVEVVGAKQKKGDVSLGERLVGVKEYTVYRIRVWSGKDNWEVERRYRDFCTLYRRLKTIYATQGWILPSSWSSVERESRKVFGNVSPAVIAERSSLIQDCLRSILLSTFASNLPNALVWFLSPPSEHTSSSGREKGSLNTLGKTISLVLDIRPQKSMKQILEAQHYTCAGCHKHFDDGKTRIWEFVQTLGWGKPRLCEYTSQLFCSSCHTNEFAVLPARVLHLWDFNQYPVSQLAKSYLDSIHDQPMLCVSAVNPFLFSKVPPLQHVTSVRKKVGAMLPYVRCPFRRSIYKALGSRRYLLESNDFFALRDLIDLSKGAFAALPVMVETVSKRILEHITEQCLVCCDAALPCNARQACDDPSSLIFPFQEGEIERCRSCDSVFHRHCFKKIARCSCGVHLNVNEIKGEMNSAIDNEVHGTLDLLGKKPDLRSSAGFLSGLFSKATLAKTLGRKDSDTVILMGTLPSNTSL